MVPVDDASALAESMKKFLQMEKSKLKFIGERARYHVAENFSREKMVEKTVGVYEA
jgi:glycosyltransferase involved in cell wall biosynthesis